MSQRIGRRRFLHGAAAAAHGLPWADSSTPPAPTANHVHSVWHDPRNGFGADLIRAHYLSGHHHAWRATRPSLPISRLGPRAVR